MENLGKICGRVASRITRGFLRWLCASRRRECALAVALRAIVAPSGGGDLQGVCQGAAVCGHARSAIEARAAQHERAAMNIALVEYGAGNLPSVERALARLGV